MNIQSVKQLVWIGAVALGGGLGWEVYDFSKNQAIDKQFVPNERIEKAIYGDVEDGVKVAQRSTVRVIELNNGFGNLNWTGKLAPVMHEPGPAEVTVVEKPKDKVADLLTITMLASSGDEKRAFAFVAFLNRDLEELMSTLADHYMMVGESLKGKYSHIEVESITPEGVLFKFNGTERESELVEFSPYGEGGIKLGTFGEGDVLLPNNALGSVSAEVAESYRRPEQIVETRRNYYVMGTESLAEIEQNYSRIMSNDMSYRRARDGAGRKRDGLEITKVRPGSIPAQLGIDPGAILISVNGHKVTTESELIAWGKRVSAQTDVWEGLFEQNGKQFTKTIDNTQN